MSKLKFISVILKTSGMSRVLSSFLVFFFISAIIIWFVDSNVTSFVDAIWFCFSAVTTIGFGDVVVTNIIARIVSIILAIYGILVIAIITGVLVYYISEMLKIKGNNSVSEFTYHLYNLDKLSQEELKELSARIKKSHKVK
jgi:voltage-gated potassium channel